MKKEIIVETSARHVHVSQADLETLFGEGYELTNKKDLSQPGQFACFEKVTVVGPKRELVCSILGPVRPDTQVELSLTDARSIGCVAPIRESGDIKGSGACKLIGPKGEVELKEGVIAAQRHIHATRIRLQLVVRVDGVGALAVGVTLHVDIAHAYQFLWHLNTLALQIL